MIFAYWFTIWFTKIRWWYLLYQSKLLDSQRVYTWCGFSLAYLDFDFWPCAAGKNLRGGQSYRSSATAARSLRTHQGLGLFQIILALPKALPRAVGLKDLPSRAVCLKAFWGKCQLQVFSRHHAVCTIDANLSTQRTCKHILCETDHPLEGFWDRMRQKASH